MIKRIRKVVIDSGVDPAHVTVIYSGIDTSVAVNHDAGKKIREQYRLIDNQPVIGTVANLFQRKGHEYLIAALAEVRRKIPDIHCLVIGEGDPDYYAFLMEMVQKQGLNEAITFTGFQSAVQAHIAAMDILFFPLMEGLGLRC
jgi:glycosyltransferase involved in cell wall biosynthesis